MKAVTITRSGGPEVLEIRQYSDPKPQTGEVSVKVRAAGINFADILARKGLYQDAPRFPFVPGYEVAGEVLEIGEQTEIKCLKGTNSKPYRITPGDRVLAMTRFNGYSETVVVPVDQIFLIPEHLSTEQAAAIPVNYLTAWQLMVMGGVQPGETLVIHNAGSGVGLAILELASLKNVRTIGTASSGKHARLLERGLDIAIDYRTENWVDRVLEYTGGLGADVIFDPVGGSNWKKSYKALRPTGRLGMFGVSEVTKSFLPGPLKFLPLLGRMPYYAPVQLMNQNKGVFGVNIGRLWSEKEKVLEWAHSLLNEINEGRIKPHVDTTFPFKQASEAHRYIEKRQNFGKVVLTPSG